MQPENKLSTPSLIILYNLILSAQELLPNLFMAGHFLLFRSLLIASSEKAFTGKPSALYCPILMLFPGGSEGKESAYNVGDLDLIGKIAGRREWQPTPVFLSRESHGQRGLVGHSPGGLRRAGHN